MCTFEESGKPRTVEEVWAAALEFAQNDERVKADVERARRLDPARTSECDFMRECAWAIFGARMRYESLRERWPAIEKAFLNWSVSEIAAQSDCVRTQVLQILNRPRKVNAVLKIAARLHDQRWGAVHAKLLEFTAHDELGNIMVTPELLAWLDELPHVGSVLAAYIAKNLGMSSIKGDVWMCRLAKWLGYSADPAGVWRMALQVQSVNGEKLNVIDTVLWHWAREQKWLTNVTCDEPQEAIHAAATHVVCVAGGHKIVTHSDGVASWEEEAVRHNSASMCSFCEGERSMADQKHGHGLCHKCYWLRRIVRRARLEGGRVVLKDSEERSILLQLLDGLNRD